MKIAIVSRANAPGGGASRIAEDLTRGLLNSRQEAVHFCAQITGPAQPFQRELFPRGPRSRLIRATQRRSAQLGLPLYLPIESSLLFRKTFAEFEVIHFHDHAATVSMGSIAELSRKKATFFTAHDFLHLTGGCIYPLGCKAYQSNCGSCPQKAGIGRFDFTSTNQNRNRQAAQSGAIRYIYPSDWLRREAELHLRWSLPAVTIPNGFDPAPYGFRNRAEARRVLGIAERRPVICISAHYLADPRKGVAYAFKAIAAVSDLRPLVILVGNPSSDAERSLPGVDFWFTGLVSSRERMGLLFAAADLFLFTSLQDNLPITIQESMAAATPVVGFATGGVPEMIENERTGWLVPTGNQDELNRVLRRALTEGNLVNAGLEAQKIVTERYRPDSFVQSHLELYNQVLQKRGDIAAVA